MKRGAKKRRAKIDGLSQIEADVMQIIWRKGKTTVREIHEEMLPHGYIPYTTVMAVMANLAQKGVLKQNRNGKAYLYNPAISSTKIANDIVDSIVDRILDGSPKPIIAHLLGLKSEAEVDELIELKSNLGT